MAKEEPKEKITFSKLPLCPEMLEACEERGWELPTPIQAAAIEPIIEGRDVIGLAETGSGKTAAFALPIIHKLLDVQQPFFALVLAPTRELAFQICDVFNDLGENIGIRTTCIVGDMDMMNQIKSLSLRPHIIVGTPGRLVDHLDSKTGLTLDSVRFVVLDEADRLLNAEFKVHIDKLINACSNRDQTLLFSATMTPQVERLAEAQLFNAHKIDINKAAVVSNLLQTYVLVEATRKMLYLDHLLSQFAGRTIIIFVDTRDACNITQRVLDALDFRAVTINGSMRQNERLAALDKFRNGEKNILVATDVAARGLDEDVDIVMNYDLPQSVDTYTHRVGRTARAGRGGLAINFITQYDIEYFQALEKKVLDRQIKEQREVDERRRENGEPEMEDKPVIKKMEALPLNASNIESNRTRKEEIDSIVRLVRDSVKRKKDDQKKKKKQRYQQKNNRRRGRQ
ncbi:hypothetical protein PCE1_003778 [Barthelona sp. PCE]